MSSHKFTVASRIALITNTSSNAKANDKVARVSSQDNSSITKDKNKASAMISAYAKTSSGLRTASFR